MPTEWRDAWPDTFSTNIECPSELATKTVSSRKASEEDVPMTYYEVRELMEEFKKEQTQKMTIFTVIVVVLFLVLMNQVDSLKREIRYLVAVQGRP